MLTKVKFKSSRFKEQFEVILMSFKRHLKNRMYVNIKDIKNDYSKKQY